MGRPTIRASIRSRSTKAVVVVRHRRRLWQCRGCGKQTSATAGTILDHTRLALSVWFYAAFLMATDKRGVSALLLDRQLGLGNHKTGWFAFRKMRRAMVNPNRSIEQGRSRRVNGPLTLWRRIFWLMAIATLVLCLLVLIAATWPRPCRHLLASGCFDTSQSLINAPRP